MRSWDCHAPRVHLVGRVYSSVEHAHVHDWIVSTASTALPVCAGPHAWTIAQRVAFCGAIPGAGRTCWRSTEQEVATAATTPTSAVLLADPDTGARVAPADGRCRHHGSGGSISGPDPIARGASWVAERGSMRLLISRGQLGG